MLLETLLNWKQIPKTAYLKNCRKAMSIDDSGFQLSVLKPKPNWPIRACSHGRVGNLGQVRSLTLVG